MGFGRGLTQDKNVGTTEKRVVYIDRDGMLVVNLLGPQDCGCTSMDGDAWRPGEGAVSKRGVDPQREPMLGWSGGKTHVAELSLVLSFDAKVQRERHIQLRCRSITSKQVIFAFSAVVLSINSVIDFCTGGPFRRSKCE
jgi:hypothetical protein